MQCGDADQRVPSGLELIGPVDIGVPLVAIKAVLVALVLDQDLVGPEYEVDTADRPVIVPDDKIRLRLRQTGQH